MSYALAAEVWKTRIELLWVILAVLYSIAADQKGLVGRSGIETSTTLLLVSGFLVVAMLVHMLNREETDSPRDLLLWAFTASMVCANSAFKLGDYTGTALTVVYALLFAGFVWFSPARRSNLLLQFLLRCVLCTSVAGTFGLAFTGLIHFLNWDLYPYVTIFPVSSAAFSALVFALLTNPYSYSFTGDLAIRASTFCQQWMIPLTICILGAVFFAICGYLLLPERLHTAWGLAISTCPLVGAVIGLSLALFVTIPLGIESLTLSLSRTRASQSMALVVISGLGGTSHGAIVFITNSLVAEYHAPAAYFVLIEFSAALLTITGILAALAINTRLSPNLNISRSIDE